MLASSHIYHVVVGTSWLSIVLSGFIGSVVGVIGALYAASHLFRKQRLTDISAARILRKHDLALARKRHDDDRRLAAENAQLQAAIQINALLNSAQSTMFLAAATGDPQKETMSFLEVDGFINAAFSLASLLSADIRDAIERLFIRAATRRRSNENLEDLEKRLRQQAIDFGYKIQTVMASVRDLIKDSMPEQPDELDVLTPQPKD